MQWVRRLARYGGKRKHSEVLVEVECPGKQFASLSLPEVCHDELCLGLGLLWTWESCVFVGTFYHDTCVPPGYFTLNPWTLLQNHSQSKEWLCFLTSRCCKTMFFLIIPERFWYICGMIAGSGINVNSAVNRLTLCTALQGTEINQILWTPWEEPCFNCIFGHRVSLSQVQISVCPRAGGIVGHATAWRNWWVHLYLEIIGCDASEWLTLNIALLRFWCWFFPLSLLPLHLIEGW